MTITVDPAPLYTSAYPAQIKNLNLARTGQTKSSLGDPHVASTPNILVGDEWTTVDDFANQGLGNINGGDLSLIVDYDLKQLVSPGTSYSSVLKLRNGLSNKLWTILVLCTTPGAAAQFYANPNLIFTHINGSANTSNTSFRVANIPIDDSLTKEIPETETQRVMVSIGDGYNTTGLPFRYEFEDLPINISYLTLFVASYTVEDTGLQGLRELKRYGTISSELIIKNGDVNRQSILFYKPKTSVNPHEILWTGEAHQDSSGGWRTGKRTVAPDGGIISPAGSTALIRKSVFNSKISDNRRLDQIMRLTVNYGGAEATGLKNLSTAASERLRALKRVQLNSHNYLSDLYFSKSENNNLNLTFGLNYGSILKRNTLYGALYANYNQLLTSSSLLSIRLFRRRVRKTGSDVGNRLTGGASPNTVVNEQEVPVGNPVQINCTTSPGIFHYTITDVGMDDVTFGVYEYGVELRVLDGSLSKLTTINDQLVDSSTALDRIIVEALLPDNYDITTNRFTSYFWNTAWTSTKIAAMVTAIQSYVAAVQFLFGQTQYASLLVDLTAITNPITSGPAGLEFLKKLIDDMSANITQATKMSRPFKPMASPPAGGGPNLQRFGGAKRVFAVKRYFSQTYDADELTNYGFDFLNVETPTPSNIVRSLRVVSTTEWNGIAAKQISKMASGLTGSATSTGTPPVATTMAIQQGVQFLTPNYLHLMRQGPIDLTATDSSGQAGIQGGMYMLAAAHINSSSPLDLATGQMSPIDANSTNMSTMEGAELANQTSMINYNGCTVALAPQVLNEDWNELFTNNIPSTQAFVDTDAIPLDAHAPFSSTSPFVEGELSGLRDPDGGVSHPGAGTLSNVEAPLMANKSLIPNYLLQTDFFNGNSTVSTSLMTISNNSYLKSQNMTLEGFKASLLANIPNTSNLPSLPSAGIALAPHDQVVSATELEFLDEAIAGNLRPQDLPLIAAKYGFIHIVEYIDSYAAATIGDGMGEYLVAAPRWRPLTTAVINSVVNGGTPRICRLRKHETILGNFDGLKAPNYNEHFLLMGDAAITPFTATNPLTNPSVPLPPVPPPLVNSLSTEQAEVNEYSNSSDPDAPKSEAPKEVLNYNLKTIKNGSAATIPLAGPTSVDLNHKHEYVIDRYGNGIAKEVCHPQYPNVCHSHEIKNYQVTEGGSKHIDAVNGLSNHIHSLASSSSGALSGTGSSSGTGGY